MDFFTEEERYFLVMEFIPGYDLAEWMEMNDGPLPLQRVLRWTDDLLQALEYLHRRNPPILHRDIKPENIMLTKDDEVKIREQLQKI